MQIYSNLLPLVDLYDVFFVDIYGVLFDGIKLYREAIFALEYLKNHGKQVIILSNTTELAESAQMRYSRRGLLKDLHYDYFVTSGEFLRRSIQSGAKALSKNGMIPKNVKCLFMGNGEIFENTAIHKVESFDDADILYVGLPRSHNSIVRIDNVSDSKGNHINIEDVLDINWHTTKCDDGLRCGLQDFAHDLDICLKKNKSLVVANPDIFAHSAVNNERRLVITQGAIGAYYKKIGGSTIYFGKPYPDIFEFAKSFVSPNTRMAMIGDTPWTDIAGANNVDINSILVCTGIPTELYMTKLTVEENIDHLISVTASKINHSPYKDVTPTHIINAMRV